MSNARIVSIRDMINSAFGDEEINYVNFKLIQAVLHILARELRVLDRRVEIPNISGMDLTATPSGLAVTEVKLQAMIEQKKGLGPQTKEGRSKSKEKTVDKVKSVEQISTDTRRKSLDRESDKKLIKKDFHNRLDSMEEQRERELRIINQRADSHVEPATILTPMASVPHAEVQQEKLLIIERGRSRESQAMSDTRIEKLSIVTIEQFEKLVKIVKEMEKKFEIGMPTFPENAQLMKDLHKGASLTDAMSALQMSARLEAAEKTLQQMLSLVTDLAAVMPAQKVSGKSVTEVLFSGATTPQDKKHKKGVSNADLKPVKSKPSAKSEFEMPIDPTNQASTIIQDAKMKPDWISIDQLYQAMEDMNSKIYKLATEDTQEAITIANAALKMSKNIEQKMLVTSNVGSRLQDVENLLSNYAEQINTLDTSLSSAMTYYQEQLTQMEHELETALENMAEALANVHGDPEVVAELNGNFTSLQIELESTFNKQKQLHDEQKYLQLDVQNLFQQIELLREAKSDRDEVHDALRDKAGIDALNGMVTEAQFGAVRGDLEKQIFTAYDKFNNQELVWQKAIDELLRVLSDKADTEHVIALRDDVLRNLEMLKNRYDELAAIVGEPNSSTVTRQIHRDTNCLCCSTPANLKLNEGGNLPILPALPSIKVDGRNAEIASAGNNFNESGDDGRCYPGYQIPHQIDSRAHVCHRYCGGSHTIVTDKITRAPLGIVLKSLSRGTPGVGSDGKTYLINEENAKKPCVSCNLPKNQIFEPAVAADAEGSGQKSLITNELFGTEYTYMSSDSKNKFSDDQILLSMAPIPE